MTAPLLRVTDVSKSFGGLRAVSRLSFEVEDGEILGLIGPNGAGKTTVFNLITRLLELDEGEIVLFGRSILGLKPHAVCALGLTRTFQLVKPFAELTVLENVMVGAFHRARGSAAARREALGVLELLKLDHRRDQKAASLTISDRKLLEIARARATRPRLLLLDEPMAGMNPTEVEQMMRQIEAIRQDGITIVVIEHVMRAIMSISDRVIVLRQGEKIATGTPKEVSRDPGVVAAYLGEALVVP